MRTWLARSLPYLALSRAVSRALTGCGLLVLGLVLVAPASAQIDLPKPTPKPEVTDSPKAKPGEKPGNIPEVGTPAKPQPADDSKPALVCSVCYERNTTTKISPDPVTGFQTTFCKVCQANRLHHTPKTISIGTSGLDLPNQPSRPKPVAPTDDAEPVVERQPGDPVATISGGARFILDEVRRRRRIDDDVVTQAADGLVNLGDVGISAARVALASDHGPTVMTGFRVLFRAGTPEDRDHAVTRLRTRMPAGVGGMALREMVAVDPVRATPRLLCSLLAHTQSSVRAAAHKILSEDPKDSWIPHLAIALEGKNSDARYRAVDLVAKMDSTNAREVLFQHLSDPRSKVAARAIDALARAPQPEVQIELLTRAFGDRWILRPNAYAILALIEREDARLESILGPGHQPVLLDGLNSSDPFISGTCAAALAGIGFRSGRLDETSWLDRRVPNTLVAISIGQIFFEDRDALVPPAVRRLQLITGQTFGQSGPAWAEWWLANEADFRASRAVISLAENDHQRLRVDTVDRGTGDRFTLLGPVWLDREIPITWGEPIHLVESEAKSMLELMRGLGMFTADRMPGARGSSSSQARVLEVRIGDQAKNFTFAPGSEPDWFRELSVGLQAQRDRHRWQRFAGPEAGARRNLILSDGPFFAETTDPVAWNRHLADLVMTWMKQAPNADRGLGVTELERLFAEDQVANAADVPLLLERLSEERFFTDRCQRLVGLIRIAGGIHVDADGQVSDPTQLALADDLIDRLFEQFEVDAAAPMLDLLQLQGVARVRAAAVDERALLRGLAATLIAKAPQPEDIQLLAGLVEDPRIEVRVATLRAIGENRLQKLSRPVLIAAGQLELNPIVRKEGLWAAGRMGGRDAKEVLLNTLPEPSYQLAAVRGLVELRDPTTTEVLISLLRSSRDPDVTDAARQAIENIGPGAHDALMAALNSPSPATRREASILLSRQGEPKAAGAMLRALTEDPSDVRLQNELVVLTCFDPRSEVDPLEAWWAWWDSVHRDDSLSWFRAACEANGLISPPAELFVQGSRQPDVIRFLLAALKKDDVPYLMERARRELERMTGQDLGKLPGSPRSRAAWHETLVEALLGEH